MRVQMLLRTKLHTFTSGFDVLKRGCVSSFALQLPTRPQSRQLWYQVKLTPYNPFHP